VETAYRLLTMCNNLTVHYLRETMYVKLRIPGRLTTMSGKYQRKKLHLKQLGANCGPLVYAPVHEPRLIKRYVEVV